MRADAVEELAIMRDHQQHARILEQPLFKPEHGIQIEMVGRLIEQEQIARHHQGTREIEAHAPAAGKFRHRALMGRGRKAEAMQQLAGTRLRVITVDFGHLLVRDGNCIPILDRHRGLFGHQHGMHLGIAGDDEVDRRIRQGWGFLGDAGDAQLRRFLQIARICLDLTENGSEQTGLATAVATDHADAPARVQGDIDF